MPLGISQLLRAYPIRSRRGLWGGKQVLNGHKISEFGNKTKRLFKPNVKSVYLYSEALQKKLKLQVTTNVLRQIDSSGGLDRYLLTRPDAKLFSDVGSELKLKIGLMKQQQQLEEVQQWQAELAAVRRRRAVNLVLRQQELPGSGSTQQQGS